MAATAAGRPARSKNAHGQYFTPSNVAELMVSMLTTGPEGRVLEPSAGEGVFVDALLVAGYRDVQAVEIDPGLLTDCEAEVDHQSFVTWRPEYRCDAVIGNPPYIRWKHLGEAQKDELRASPYWGTLLNSLSDYLSVFIIKSVEHLRPGGELLFITPSFWMHTQHSAPLREFLLERGAVTDIVTFGEATVFPGVSSSVMIFRFVKAPEIAPSSVRHHRYIGARQVGPDKLRLGDRGRFSPQLIPAFARGRHWTLATREVQDRLERFENWTSTSPADRPALVGSYFDIANGMVTGLDRVFRLPAAVEAQLTATERAAVARVAKAANLQVLVADAVTSYVDLPAGLTEAQATRRYPHLIAHLAEHRAELEGRYSFTGSLAFWEWSFRRSEALHLDGRTKVFVPCKERLTNRTHPRFCLAPPGAIATQDVTAMAAKSDTRESAEYLAAFLCLDEVAEWVRHKGLMKGGVAEFSERPLVALPFRAVDWSEPAEVAAHDAITETVRSAASGHVPVDDARVAVRELFCGMGLPEPAGSDEADGPEGAAA